MKLYIYKLTSMQITYYQKIHLFPVPTEHVKPDM